MSWVPTWVLNLAWRTWVSGWVLNLDASLGAEPGLANLGASLGVELGRVPNQTPGCRTGVPIGWVLEKRAWELKLDQGSAPSSQHPGAAPDI